MINFNSQQQASGTGGTINDQPVYVPLARPRDPIVPASTIAQAEEDAANLPGRSYASHAASAKRSKNEEIADLVERRRGLGCTTGCLRALLSCRCLILSILGLLVVAVILLILIFTQKPPFIYTPLKEWLNAGLQATTVRPSNTFEDIFDQAQNFKVGDNKLVITESQLQGWVADRLSSTNLKKVNVTLEEGLMKLYWDIESDNAVGGPLWLVVEVATDNTSQPVISKIGSERVGLPSFLNQLVQQLIVSVANLSGSNSEGAGGIVGALFPLPSTVSIKKIEIFDDKIELTVNLKSGLEQVFE
ncbi:MAG: hypothetical protein JNK26_04220 [Candidatus Doudnabacteria bacterium]|nr:hypothetical protein [Candidatus Doudnabacteria bacterium]